MRGTLPEMLGVYLPVGITPAYAGNTNRENILFIEARDHPRVCGEHIMIVGYSQQIMGSPPRMRGTLFNASAYGSRDGITPAYAGNT